ncbi:hypothetical protein ACFL01_00370 [Planctomycetota bacterium]
MSETTFSVQQVTTGPKHHWFGYYEKFPWDQTGQYLLAMEVDFAGRQPTAADTIDLGRIDTQNGNRFEPFAETTAWCWQMGCMLQWLPNAVDPEVIYNVRRGDTYESVIHNLDSGEKRELPRAIFCLLPDGKSALCANFARLDITRPGYGYVGIPDPFEDELAPERDGVWRMDLETGESELILSLATLASTEPSDDMEGALQWVNHIQINTDGTRFAMLHRYRRLDKRGHVTRLFTCAVAGSDLYCLNPNRKTSHYDWRDPDHILAWARTPDSSKEEPVHRYVLFTDRSNQYELVGDGILTTDGHCSWSPDQRWFLSDTYPGREDPKQILFLYEPATDRRVELGRFLSPPEFTGDWRCDLHPRWSRDGRAVCFDSAMDGTRQLYIIDVGTVTP